MSSPIDWKKWYLYRSTIEGLLREGYTPIGVAGGKGSATEEAERRLAEKGMIVKSESKSKSKSKSKLTSWARIQEQRKAKGLDHACPDWTLYRSIAASRVEPTSRVKERWILTSAQNEAAVHKPFFRNLLAYADYLSARISVGRFTYQLSTVSDRARAVSKRTHSIREHIWAPELEEYLTSERFSCGSDVLFCAEMNTLPTAVRPLSGLHTYGHGKTAIFPHAKVALEMVPTGGENIPPAVLTTGCCTLADYTDTKAGHKGVFHHVFGAVIVELDDEGNTFFRHIIAKQDGTFQDLDKLVKEGKIYPNQRVEAVTFGDIQSPFIDTDVALATWGFDTETWKTTHTGLIDVLQPHYGFYHDLIDFKSISHHEEKQPRERFHTFINNGHLVQGDIDKAAAFLTATSRNFMKSVVVESNHDRWLEKWLDRCNHRHDRDNALSFLKYEHARYLAEADGDSEFNVWRYALLESPKGRLENVSFVPEGESFTICQEHGGIECGAHGHSGPNGAYGSAQSLSKVSGKMTIGHSHSPTILDGVYQVGTSSNLKLGYNVGPSSWAHAHCITYSTGKRTLLFIKNGKWRA